MSDVDDSFASRFRALPLFAGVPNEALVAIGDDMEANYLDGDHLVRQDESPRFLYVLLEGTADIFAGPVPATRVYIDSRCAGDVIGEQAFVEGKNHSADVRARGAAKALKIPASIVESLLENPRFARNLLTAVSGKLRAATGQRYRALAERKLLFSHFRSHVNPQIVDQLLNKGEAYGQPQRVEPAFIMFSDLRDFTRLSGVMDPLDVAAQLAPYFAALVDVVHKTNGIVDKYIGDAVMAVWGHPAFGKIHADDVMDACLEMVQRVATLTFGGENIQIGIGLNVGPVFMGNVGTEEKRAFTVLGDAVNFAARYEASNKSADGEVYTITIGPAMRELISEKQRAILTARPDTKIKGAPGGAQTVYSWKGN